MPVFRAQSRMNSSYSAQQSGQRAREEATPFVSLASNRRDPVCCPRPRRITHHSGSEPIRPLRPQLGCMPLCSRQQMELWDPRPGAEVLDIILAKGTNDGGVVASSPPYFCGSPPSRAANPLVLDARFGEENAALLAPLPMPAASAAPSFSTGGRKVRVRTKLGANPAAVRIEGFDCLDRGGSRRSSCSSVSALA